MLYFIFFMFMFLFIVIMVGVVNNKWCGIDNSVYSYVSGYINEKNTIIFKIITFFGSALFLVFVLIFFYLFKITDYKFIISIMIFEVCLNNIIKFVIKRDRPNILRLVKEKSYSFPSGHTMASVCFYGILIYLVCCFSIVFWLKLIICVLLSLLIFLICLSRIYLGVHYFSDVIGGICLSICILILFIFIF